MLDFFGEFISSLGDSTGDVVDALSTVQGAVSEIDFGGISFGSANGFLSCHEGSSSLIGVEYIPDIMTDGILATVEYHAGDLLQGLSEQAQDLSQLLVEKLHGGL